MTGPSVASSAVPVRRYGRRSGEYARREALADMVDVRFVDLPRSASRLAALASLLDEEIARIEREEEQEGWADTEDAFVPRRCSPALEVAA